MTPTLYIVDDFVENPLALRGKVLEGPFEDIDWRGAKYTNVNHRNVPDVEAELSRFCGFAIDPVMRFVRLNLEGEMPHNFVHSDQIEAKYAALLYLNTNTQASGGTALWKHKELGFDRMPTQDEAEDLNENPDALRQRIEADWSDKDKWEMAGFAGMKFNRLILYPSACFHSRYPWEGFGKNSSNGRLVYVYFFN